MRDYTLTGQSIPCISHSLSRPHSLLDQVSQLAVITRRLSPYSGSVQCQFRAGVALLASFVPPVRCGERAPVTRAADSVSSAPHASGRPQHAPDAVCSAPQLHSTLIGAPSLVWVMSSPGQTMLCQRLGRSISQSSQLTYSAAATSYQTKL